MTILENEILKKEKELDEKLINSLKSKLNKEENQSSFDEVVKKGLEIARKQSEKNKNSYFGFETVTIIVSAINMLISAVVGIGGKKSVMILAHFIPQKCAERIYFIIKFGGILCPVIVTALLGLKKLKKYEETWMRHSKRYNSLRCETIDYINDIGEYAVDKLISNNTESSQDAQENISVSQTNDTEARQEENIEFKRGIKYKQRIMSILKENYSKFETNMKKK